MWKSKSNNRDVLYCLMQWVSNQIYFIINRSTESYEGCVSYGSDIVAFDEETVATAALFFMLVVMRSSWKYPIGYVLIDKISSTNLVWLISKALGLCCEKGLNVRSVPFDGTGANFSAMTSLGCMLGRTAKNICGKFSFGNYHWDIYFTPGVSHIW